MESKAVGWRMSIVVRFGQMLLSPDVLEVGRLGARTTAASRARRSQYDRALKARSFLLLHFCGRPVGRYDDDWLPGTVADRITDAAQKSFGKAAMPPRPTISRSAPSRSATSINPAAAEASSTTTSWEASIRVADTIPPAPAWLVDGSRFVPGALPESARVRAPAGYEQTTA
jgi:hypothetical protein